ncbi:MAG: GNAT family N-acetyltransferase [Verrucomicrobiota bacterium]
MNLELLPAHEIPLAEQASIFNRSFAGYLAGWSDLDAAALARFICAQGADLCYSRFLKADGGLPGFGYVNRTGYVTRIAGMGVVPDFRGTGAAAFLLSTLIDEAKTRGDEAVVLEVFEQNLTALNLYRRHGFRELMRLPGWRRAPTEDNQTADNLEEISLLSANQMQSPSEFPQIPWQVSRHSVTKLANARAYKIDNVCVVIGNPDVSPIRLHALLSPDIDIADRVRKAVAAVTGKFSRSEFFAPPIFPERFGTDIFQPLGFVREKLNQFLMRRDLH